QEIMMADLINPATAANAYATMAKSAGSAPSLQTEDKVSFGDILQNKAQDALRVMRAGETASAKAITGEASLPEVVQAVNAAELTLQTVTAVRDRLVSAYQEIMRMPV